MGRRVAQKASLDSEASKLLVIARTVEASLKPAKWRERQAERIREIARELLAPPADDE